MLQGHYIITHIPSVFIDKVCNNIQGKAQDELGLDTGTSRIYSGKF